MQCLNATIPLTNIYINNQDFKDCDQSTNSKENSKPVADNNGRITIPSHDPKKKEKNKKSSTTIENENINKRFKEFLSDARRNKNKCCDPSPLFKSFSNLLKVFFHLNYLLTFFL